MTRMKFLSCVILASFCVASPGELYAQGGPAEQAPRMRQGKPLAKLKRPPKEERERPYWKGMLVADIASVGIGALAAATIEPLEPNSYFSYHGAFLHAASLSGAIAVPTVHWSNGNEFGGFGSMALRLSMPPLASLGGVAVACLPYAIASGEFIDRCGQKGAAFGYLVGYAGSLMIDYAGLATIPRGVRHPERWYGWQIGLIDIAALGLSAGILYQGYRNTGDAPWRVSPVIIGTMGATFGSIGSPIVHLAHRNWIQAFLGFGARFVGLIGGTALTFLHMCAASGAEGDREQECLEYGALTGMLVGYSLGAAIDIALLARKPLPDEEAMPEQARRDAPRWQIFPAASAGREGSTFGLGVRF